MIELWSKPITFGKPWKPLINTCTGWNDNSHVRSHKTNTNQLVPFDLNALFSTSTSISRPIRAVFYTTSNNDERQRMGIDINQSRPSEGNFEFLYISRSSYGPCNHTNARSNQNQRWKSEPRKNGHQSHAFRQVRMFRCMHSWENSLWNAAYTEKIINFKSA